MTKIIRSRGGLKVLMLLMAIGFSLTSVAQYDTLHLYYNNISVTPHDTTLAKMDKWIKSLNGKHQDMKVVGYYHKLEFKKYAQERVDEMFLVINRKARSLFTIEEMVTRKGKDFQRTTVDLIYKPTGGAVAAKEKPATKEKEGAKAETKGEKEETKTAKAKKEEKESDKEEKAEKPKKEKPAKEEKEKSSKDDDEKDKKDDKKVSEKKEKEKKKTKEEKPGKTETWEAKPIE
jgi:hypothetical protein